MKGAKNGPAAARQLAILSAGLVAGGLLTTVTAASVSPHVLKATSAITLNMALFAVAVAVVVTDIQAFQANRYSLLGWRRQTPKSLQYTGLPDSVISLVRGLDLGTGVSTYRVSGAIWVVLAAAGTGHAPWWVGSLYAVGFAAGLLASIGAGGPALRGSLHRGRRAALLCSIVSTLFLLVVLTAMVGGQLG